MRKGIKRVSGYTLIEMLLVMAIIVILGAFGIASYTGFRETMTAKENVEAIKQDIQLTRQKAMNIKKGDDTNWLYGIGIDFRPYIDQNSNKQRYVFFKWCSAFEEFGDPLTKGSLPNYRGGRIGTRIKMAPTINGCEIDYRNGILPKCYSNTNKCIPNFPSFVEITGESNDLLVDLDVDQVKILNFSGSTPAFILFEAITGRAIIYDQWGVPKNYNNNGQYISSAEVPLDIAITRKRSSKFDLITIYPLSGAVVHHVYSGKDISSKCGGEEGADINCIKIDGKIYDRYTLFDEIESYRKE